MHRVRISLALWREYAVQPLHRDEARGARRRLHANAVDRAVSRT